jgi:hypothetical protein
MTHLVPLAKEVDQNKVTPGVLGFIVFAALALAVWGLMKSMNRHMGKITFEEGPERKAGPSGRDGGAAPASGSAASSGGKASPAKG